MVERTPISWYLKQLVPMTYITQYFNARHEKTCSVWKMWFGKVLWNYTFEVVDS